MVRMATIMGMDTVMATDMVMNNVKTNREDVFPTFSEEERGSHRFI